MPMDFIENVTQEWKWTKVNFNEYKQKDESAIGL